MIDFGNFCIFYAIMSRPDPQVDIAFMLMDRSSRGAIGMKDFTSYVDKSFDLKSDFIRRFFGGGKELRIQEFGQFLVELQREKGRQAFVKCQNSVGDNFGYIPASNLVQILKASCGWRLPPSIITRLESLYLYDPLEAAQHTAIVAAKAAKTKKGEGVAYASQSILENIETSSKHLGGR